MDATPANANTSAPLFFAMSIISEQWTPPVTTTEGSRAGPSPPTQRNTKGGVGAAVASAAPVISAEAEAEAEASVSEAESERCRFRT